jgi:hypothetical protein
VPVTTEQILTAGGVLAPIVAGAFASWMKSLHASVKGLEQQGADTNEALAVIKTTLVGPTGDNGIASEVRGLRKRVHSLGDDLHTVKAAQEVFRVRLDNYEDRQS